MFKSLRFSVTYAVRNMIRDRQRTIFALFSIAAGVATVVALRMLGLMVTDALTLNVQAIQRGDLVVRTAVAAGGLKIGAGDQVQDTAYSAYTMKWVQDWAARNKVEVTFALVNFFTQTSLVRNGQPGAPSFILATFIDPKVYPFYDTIRSEDPPGVALKDLITGADQVVVARRLADQMGIQVGDKLHINPSANLQTVKGIVPDTAQASFGNPLQVIFSFVLLDHADASQFGQTATGADEAYFRLPPTMDPAALAARVRKEWPSSQDGRPWRTDTVQMALQRNQFTANAVSRFVLLFSLIALVIGGMGIVNTMLVSVNRRSTEIAILKTVGLRGGGVALLFLSEAVISAIVGSLIGLGLGMLFSVGVKVVGEQAFGVALPWHFHLDPLLLGMGMGLLMTIVFSALPTLVAGQIRPGLVLRQGNIPLARTGAFQLLFSLTILIVSMGLLVDAIVGNPFDLVNAPRFIPRQLPFPPGLVGTLFLFIGLGFILALLWLLVWLLGRLPSMRDPNLRLAIRGLTLQRGRTAVSLLALIVGMTALSGTLIGTRSINTLLDTSLSEPLGGNVVALPLIPGTDTLVRTQLSAAPGVDGYRDIRFSQTSLRAIDGDRGFAARLVAPDEVQRDIMLGQLNFMIGVNIHGNPPRGTLVAGRFLTADDAGKNVVVVPDRPEFEALGVKIGAKLTYRIGRIERVFEVVGLVAPDQLQGVIPFSLGDSAVQAPLDSIPRNLPFDLIIASVQPDSLHQTLATVGTVPGTFVFDISVFDTLINRLLHQIAALPLLVAAMSLFAATVLIATTVSLATLERRRQIGILKAIGVTRLQTLNQLLIENGIVGVAGGIISLLPTFAIIQLVPAFTFDVVHLPLPVDLTVLMLALSVAITLGATLLTAWSASAERPLSVLRYE